MQQKSVYCAVFDSISASVTTTFKVGIDPVVTVAESGDSIVVVTKDRQAYKFGLESSKHAKGTVHPEKMIAGVEDVQANRYCILVLTTDGRLWVSGKDSIKIGILGLGEKNYNSKSLQLIPTEDPVVMISLADSYSVALTQTNEILLWGTTLDNFLGENISQTHFSPTKIELSHNDFEIQKIFADPQSLFLVRDNNEIECLTLAGGDDTTRSLTGPTSKLDSYKLPRFCDDRFQKVCKFSSFVVLLTSAGELYFYDKQDREIHTLASSSRFCSVTTSKHRLLAHDQVNAQLVMLSASLYGKTSFLSLDRKVICMSAFEGYTLCHQLRMGQALLITENTSVPADSMVDVSRKQKTTGSIKRQLIFEKSYIRMKYKELRSHSKSPSDLSRTFTMNTELANIARLQQAGSAEMSSEVENQRIDSEMNRSDKHLDRFNETGIQELHSRLRSKHSPKASLNFTENKVQRIMSPAKHIKTMSLTAKHDIRIEDQRIDYSEVVTEVKNLARQDLCKEKIDIGSRKIKAQVAVALKSRVKCLPSVEIKLKGTKPRTKGFFKKSSKRQSEDTEYPDQRSGRQPVVEVRMSKHTEDTFQISYTTVSPRIDGTSRGTRDHVMKSGESNSKGLPTGAGKGAKGNQVGTTSLTLLSSPSAFLPSNSRNLTESRLDLEKLHFASYQTDLAVDKDAEEKCSNIYESKESVNIRSLGGSGSKSPDTDALACRMQFINEFAMKSQISEKEGEAKLKKLMAGQADKMFAEFQQANNIISPNTTIKETVREDLVEEERSSHLSSVQPVPVNLQKEMFLNSTFEREKGYEIGLGGPLDFKKASFDSSSNKGYSILHQSHDGNNRNKAAMLLTDSVELLDPYMMQRRSAVDHRESIKVKPGRRDLDEREELIKIQHSKNLRLSKSNKHIDHLEVESVERISVERPHQSFVSRITASPSRGSRASRDDLNITKEIDASAMERIMPVDMRSDVTLTRPLHKLKKLCNQDRSRSRGNTSAGRVTSKETGPRQEKTIDRNTSKDKSEDKSARDSISIYQASVKRSKRLLSPNRSGEIATENNRKHSLADRRRVVTGREKSHSFLQNSSFHRRPSAHGGSLLGSHHNTETAAISTGLSEIRQVFKKKFSKYCAQFMTNLKLKIERQTKRNHQTAYFAREFNLIFTRMVKDRLRNFIKIVSLSETKLNALKNIKAVLGLKNDLKKLKSQISVEGKSTTNDQKSRNDSFIERASTSTKGEGRRAESFISPARTALPPRPKSGSRPASRPGSRPGSAGKKSSTGSTKRAEAEKATGLKFYGWRHLGTPKMYQRGAFKLRVKA